MLITLASLRVELRHACLEWAYLNLPIFLRCENISPPEMNGSTMYRLELS